jgi:hypothetical protein
VVRRKRVLDAISEAMGAGSQPDEHEGRDA